MALLKWKKNVFYSNLYSWLINYFNEDIDDSEDESGSEISDSEIASSSVPVANLVQQQK